MNIGLPQFDFNRVLMNSSLIFGSIDQDGIIIFVNNTCKYVLGYEPEEMIGKHFFHFLRSEDHQNTADIIKAALQNHTNNVSFENRYLHKLGFEVPIHWSGIWSEGDGVLHCVGKDITEQKAINKKLAESEQRYKALFDNSPDIIFVENHFGVITEVNQRFLNTFSVQPEDVLGQNATTFFSPEISCVNSKNFEYAILGSSVRFDMELNLGGNLVTFDTVKHPIYLNGQITEVQTIAKDITPIVRSYNTIQSQAKKLNTIFESITEAFCLIDRNWNYTYTNKEFNRILNIRPGEFLGKNIWDIYPDGKKSIFYEKYAYAMETGKSVRFEAFSPESQLWLDLRVFPSEEGLSIYFTDITQDKLIHDKLEKLSLVASKTTNGVALLDRDRKIEWINEGFTKLTGFKLNEVQGKKPVEFMAHDNTDIPMLIEARDKTAAGESASYEILNRAKDGKDLWLSIDMTPLYDEHGHITGYITIQTDITALKHSQIELSKLAKDLYTHNKDLEQFTYIVSHNLRSPIANAIGLAELLHKIGKDHKLYDQTLQNLKKSTYRLDEVVKDMNSILNIRDSKGTLEREQVFIKEVCEQVFMQLREPLNACGGNIICKLPQNLSVYANKAYLYSIFYNLFSNSIKYRDESRTLEIIVQSHGNSSKGVFISFSDNGTGFDMAKAKGKIFKLYKRFHRSKEGRGLGLYLVKTHLEAMGGHIEVNSAIGEGTRFLIYLPKS